MGKASRCLAKTEVCNCSISILDEFRKIKYNQRRRGSLASRASEMSVHPGKEDGCTLISIDYQRKNRRFRYAEGTRLLGAEDTVAGVAQTRNDVTVVVQTFILRGAVDVHIGMRGVNGGDAFRRGDDVHQRDAARRRRLPDRAGALQRGAGGE